jgi:hypothetical protein
LAGFPDKKPGFCPEGLVRGDFEKKIFWRFAPRGVKKRKKKKRKEKREKV